MNDRRSLRPWGRSKRSVSAIVRFASMKFSAWVRTLWTVLRVLAHAPLSTVQSRCSKSIFSTSTKTFTARTFRWTSLRNCATRRNLMISMRLLSRCRRMRRKPAKFWPGLSEACCRLPSLRRAAVLGDSFEFGRGSGPAPTGVPIE